MPMELSLHSHLTGLDNQNQISMSLSLLPANPAGSHYSLNQGF